MDVILGGIAFALMLAGQFLAVVVVHDARLGDESEYPDFRDDTRGRHIWLLGT